MTTTNTPMTRMAHPLQQFITPETVVDLTLLLAEDLPCTWPGHQWYQHKTFSWYADRPDRACGLVNRTGVPYQTRWVVLDEHTGTHLDAPSHFIPPTGSGLAHAGPAGDACLDQVSLGQTMGPAAVIDIRHLDGQADPGVSPAITADMVTAWEKDHGPIASGDVVLFHSGWDRHYQRGSAGSRYGWDVLITAKEVGWPAPDADCVIALYERGVGCLGTDGLSMGAAQDGAPAHLAGLSRGMVFVEALTNLARLPARGAYFLMLPVRIEEGTGGPGRAIGVLPGAATAAASSSQDGSPRFDTMGGPDPSRQREDILAGDPGRPRGSDEPEPDEPYC